MTSIAIVATIAAIGLQVLRMVMKAYKMAKAWDGYKPGEGLAEALGYYLGSAISLGLTIIVLLALMG